MTEDNGNENDDLNSNMSVADSLKNYELEIINARNDHADVKKRQEPHERQLDLFSVMAMKTPILVAAAGIAAVLGFYSANYSTLSTAPENLLTFNCILSSLFISLLFGMLAPCAAYFSQSAFIDSETPKHMQYERPFVKWDKKKQKRYVKKGRIFRYLTIFFVGCSIVSIVVGGFLFLKLL